MSLPYAYIAPSQNEKDKDLLSAEQLHYQTKIKKKAFALFQASRRYSRGLTRANIKVSAAQQARLSLDITGYQTSNKCTQITLSRLVNCRSISKSTNAHLKKMEKRMQKIILQNEKMLERCRKTPQSSQARKSRSQRTSDSVVIADAHEQKNGSRNGTKTNIHRGNHRMRKKLNSNSKTHSLDINVDDNAPNSNTNTNTRDTTVKTKVTSTETKWIYNHK